MPLFLDIEALSARQTDLALGFIYKAVHGHDDDDEIWSEHPSPMIRTLVELFTRRGLARLENVRRELVSWLNGERHSPTLPPQRPVGMMQRWSPAEIELANRYLEAMPVSEWTLYDHMMVVDLLVQRYLPPDELKTEAEWLTVRAALMGKVQAGLGELSAAEADKIAARLPLTASGSNTQGLQRAVIELAANRAAEHVTSLGDGARHRMRSLVAQRVEKTMTGDLSGPSLQTQLVDEFATLNRDWRRIAVTEATEALGQGFVAAQAPGVRLKRVEQYRNACSWCRKLDGKLFEVVDPAAPDRDGETQIWAGKNNVGRSSAPRKRVGDKLVEREPGELFWCASGAQHPNCRGRWVPVITDEPGDDAEFGEWLRATLARPDQKA